MMALSMLLPSLCLQVGFSLEASGGVLLHLSNLLTLSTWGQKLP